MPLMALSTSAMSVFETMSNDGMMGTPTPAGALTYTGGRRAAKELS
jgi:hypothetical protein